MLMRYRQVLSILIALISGTVFATPIEEVLVTGGRDNIKTLSGSAHLLDSEQLELFNYTDIQRMIGSVPGVYIRTEDGYGLRPNIGMRGAPSERSQKIVLMEDSVLIGPAPYAAPAAYYFPNAARMSSLEVFKGPAGILFGPNTVGGALNMASTPIPEQSQSKVSVAVGADQFNKTHLWHGSQFGNFSYLLEGLRISADGFKQLDDNAVQQNVGFTRNDILLKLAYSFNQNHRLALKLSYADEDSNETYLGLTDADFAQNPNRRYFSSQYDRMVWDHQQIMLSHTWDVSDALKINTKVYRNDFKRSWNKLDNSDDWNFSIADVLDNPDGVGQQPYYLLLTGQMDTINERSQLRLTDNARNYYSQGLQTDGVVEFSAFTLAHQLQFGLRWHEDSVSRNHQPDDYNIINGVMVSAGENLPVLVLNEDTVEAVSVYVRDEMTVADWVLSAGVRIESIQGRHLDQLNVQAANKETQDVLIPGLGAFYQFNQQLGFLVGVNRGFSPSAPGPGEAIYEESTNWEYGLRYEYQDYRLEAIGFFNDYQNFVGRCRVSDAGCTAGEQFNGGAIEIAGLELLASAMWSWQQLQFPAQLVYSYTESAFQHSFNAAFSQWGNVQQGDALPYLPQHQLRLGLGIKSIRWDLNLAISFNDKMREQASQGSIDHVAHTESYTVLDLAFNYWWSEQLSAKFSVDNLTDEAAIVSRRPFGARPNKPRAVILGLNYEF